MITNMPHLKLPPGDASFAGVRERHLPATVWGDQPFPIIHHFLVAWQIFLADLTKNVTRNGEYWHFLS
jgi:hypothetical protein